MRKAGCTGSVYYTYHFKVLIAILLLAPALPSYTQSVPQKATRQTAVDAFSGGKYDIAFTQFSELSSLYPKDPLYKYYLGACLVKLEKQPLNASALLEEAIRESAAIRPAPAEAHFYLGRAKQMSGKFNEAISSYEHFAEIAGKKTAKEMDVTGFIRQCEDQKGSINTGAEDNQGQEVKNTIATSSSDVEKGIAGNARSSNDTTGPEGQQLPYSYDRLLAEAVVLQTRSDSAMSAAGRYRAGMEGAEGAERTALWKKASDLEKIAASLRAEADSMMAEAGKLAGLPTDTLKEKPTGAGTVVEITPVDSMTPENDELTVIKADSASAQAMPKDEKISSITRTPVFSEFRVTEKPVYKADDKVAVNPEVPAGLIYRIQLAVFRNPVAPSYFKGISPVNGFRNAAAGITTYYAGMFRKSSDAGKALNKVKSLGFKDAFVVALMDKKAVSSERASLLEKEWGTKPLYTREEVRDTIPPTLVFRVEVKRSPKPLPKDQVANIEKIAGTRGFDIIVTESKQNIYLAGNFFTYKSASEYADLLIRNGYRDAKVVAYLGSREIPVDTARQLFDEQ